MRGNRIIMTMKNIAIVTFHRKRRVRGLRSSIYILTNESTRGLSNPGNVSYRKKHEDFEGAKLAEANFWMEPSPSQDLYLRKDKKHEKWQISLYS